MMKAAKRVVARKQAHYEHERNKFQRKKRTRTSILSSTSNIFVWLTVEKHMFFRASPGLNMTTSFRLEKSRL